MTLYKDAGEKNGLNLLIPKCKMETFLFATMTTACQLYDCCDVAEYSVLLAALGASLEEELSLGDSHCLKF